MPDTQDLQREAALVRKCESPIEVQLCTSLTALLFDGTDRMTIFPQFGLGSYRYDFALLSPKDTKPLVLIECDGKGFHSLPHQLDNDRRKDAKALAFGVEVIRFTGRQIFLEPVNCARLAIFRAALQIHERGLL
jgi:very-short-patch-repair endonuclease